MAGIYIHIPFCRSKCIYCDFYSIGANEALVDSYIGALVSECRLRYDELRGEAVHTVYIGGGTPSLLSLNQLKRLIDGIGSIVDLKCVEEFTVEVNPDDVSHDFVSGVSALGVNRVSMGIQSFVDYELSAINRRHTANQAIVAVDTIRNAGISNISIDLIYGLPGQTIESWDFSLSEAVKLNVPHISCYNLSYEEGTRLYRMRESGLLTECSDDDCIAMYKLLSRRMRDSRYEHYEVSNFAKPEMYSRHNSAYWSGVVYLGLGASAHSFDGVSRSYNIANVRRYIELMSSGTLACERELLSKVERYDEYVMIHMRTSRGVDVKDIIRIFGSQFASHFVGEAQRHVDTRLLLCDDGVYCLTDEGVMLSDMIIRDLMW